MHDDLQTLDALVHDTTVSLRARRWRQATLMGLIPGEPVEGDELRRGELESAPASETAHDSSDC